MNQNFDTYWAKGGVGARILSLLVNFGVIEKAASDSAPTAATTSWPTTKQVIAWSLVALCMLVVLFTFVVSSANAVATQQLGAAAALALITAAAVAIERTIEAFWTTVGLAFQTWSPLRPVGEQIKTSLSDANHALTGFVNLVEHHIKHIEEHIKDAKEQLDDAVSNFEKVKSDASATVAQLADARQQVEQAKLVLKEREDLKIVSQDSLKTVEGLKTSTVPSVRDGQEALLYVSRVGGNIAFLQKLVPELQSKAGFAQQFLATLSNFVETFKDNPARRLISIYLGSMIGLAAAWLLGLDVFQAVLQPSPPANASENNWQGLGVALTGIVIGLGANPTHQVIRLLEEYKKSKKIGNTLTVADEAAEQ